MGLIDKLSKIGGGMQGMGGMYGMGGMNGMEGMNGMGGMNGIGGIQGMESLMQGLGGMQGIMQGMMQDIRQDMEGMKGMNDIKGMESILGQPHVKQWNCKFKQNWIALQHIIFLKNNYIIHLNNKFNECVIWVYCKNNKTNKIINWNKIQLLYSKKF